MRSCVLSATSRLVDCGPGRNLKCIAGVPMKNKSCKGCGSDWHTLWKCPYRAIPYHTTRPRKPLKKIGKVGRTWIATKHKWLEQNKAPYYWCYYCDKQMTRTQLTLDHKLSRSRYPELRYVLSNLVPCCYNCNKDKGSRSAEEYMALD